MRNKGKKNLIVLDSAAHVSVGRSSSRRRFSIDDRRRDAILKIMICFVLPVVILLSAWGIISVAAEIMKPDVSETIHNPSIADDERIYDDSDSLTILFIKISDDRKSGEQFLLARFEPSEGHIYVASLNPQTLAQGVSLSEHFESGGAAKCASAVSELTGCSSVYTAQLSYTNIKKLVTQIGGVTISVPYSINYRSPNNDRNLNVAAGTRLYEGGETARLLNYPDWEGGEEEHMRMYRSVLTTALNEQLYGLEQQELLDLFTLFYSNCTADITMGTYQRASDGLTLLASQEDDNLALEAEFSPSLREDGSYVFEGEELKLLQAVFGDRD